MIIVILILIIIGTVTLFSIQNITSVTVSLLVWRFETTVPILVSVAMLLGVFVEQLVRQWAARRSAKDKKQEDIP